MKFDAWMRSRGLSESSVQKYLGAIQGVLTDWANVEGISTGPLISISSLSIFEQVSSKLSTVKVFIDRNATGHHMYSSALAKFAQYLADDKKNDIEAEIDRIFDDKSLSSTERKNLVKSRIGQGVFRQRVLSIWSKCSVTGFDDTGMLIASHIKPWRVANDSERLDGFNGLLLTPNLDKAFDSGLITFDKTGKIEISPFFLGFERLGIQVTMRVELHVANQSYMDFHRRVIYRSTGAETSSLKASSQ